MDSRDTKSNAPMPSIESTVARSSNSVLTCKMWAMGSGGHCVLVWRCGDLDSWPNMLSNGSGHQPPHLNLHHDTPDAARRSLQCSAAHLHSSEDFLGDACSRESLAEKPKLVATCQKSKRGRKCSAVMPARCHLDRKGGS